jgi:hypothetical protein
MWQNVEIERLGLRNREEPLVALVKDLTDQKIAMLRLVSDTHHMREDPTLLLGQMTELIDAMIVAHTVVGAHLGAGRIPMPQGEDLPLEEGPRPLDCRM